MCSVRRAQCPAIILTCLLSVAYLGTGQVISVTEVPVCNATYFRCAASGCLNVSLVCNGEDDCGDNSDEDPRYAGCQGARRLSGGFIAAIAIGSLVGAILVCCWISSVIECIQHMYKYWCSCCHDSDINDITFTTTVIPNPGADPTTIVIAGTLPPSYSSIFRNDAAFFAEASQTPTASSYSNGNIPVQHTSQVQTVGPRPPPINGNIVVSQHCQHCQCQCQRQPQQHQHRQQIPMSLPLPDYPPPSYDPAKDIRWC